MQLTTSVLRLFHQSCIETLAIITYRCNIVYYKTYLDFKNQVWIILKILVLIIDVKYQLVLMRMSPLFTLIKESSKCL